jgi:hypothetical protein
MIKAQYIYNILLSYDIDSEHNEALRKRLIEEEGFQNTIRGINEQGNVAEGKLPESTLFKSMTTTNESLEIFNQVCNELGIVNINAIAVQCDNWSGLIETGIE